VLHVLDLHRSKRNGEAESKNQHHFDTESDFGCSLVRCHEWQVVVVMAMARAKMGGSVELAAESRSAGEASYEHSRE